MSGKSAKKKRFGSRRVAPNQNVSSDEIRVTDDSSVAQHHALEESSESLNVSSNPDDSKPETQQTPSPDATMSRRKLGSSRRNKGRQFAKDSETEPYLEHREEVEEKTRGNKTVETTQTSLAAQLDRQEESSQGSVQDTSATPNSSLSSASTPDYYYSEAKSPSTSNSPEDVTEISTHKPGNLQADQARDNETKLENDDKSDTPQSAEMEKNVGILELPHLSSLPSLSAEQQLINIQLSDSKEMSEEELSHVYSVPEMGSNKNDDADLFRQDESLQGNTSESDSQVGSVALESDTDKSSPRENTAIKDNTEQTIFLLPKEELPASEKLEELFNLSELRDDQRLQDTVTNVHEQDLQATQMQKVDQDDDSPESLILDATENVDSCAANLKDQAEIGDVNQFELSGKVTDDFAPKQEVSNPDDKQDEHPIKADNLEADFKVVCDKSVGATLEGVDKSDKGAGRSENDVQNVQEEEGQTTEMQKMQQIDNLSASAIDDATDNSKITEIIATLPSEVMVKSIDDSATKQEVSNPDDKKDEQPTKEDNIEALDQISPDNPSYDKTLQTSDIERVDTPLVQVSESEGTVEGDVKPNPEQTVHQEAAQLSSEMGDIKVSLQSFESETNVASDSQPHDSSAGIDEETNTGNTQTTEVKNTSPGFQQSGIRRKLGSSRRNKGRQPVKESKEKADENTTSDEALKIIMSITTSEGDFKEMPDKSVGATLEEIDTPDTVAHQSEVNVKKMQEEEGKTAEILQIDNISANTADDATDISKIVEIIATLPPAVMVTSTEDSATKQEEVSNPDDKKDAQPTKGENLGASDQRSEDNPPYDSQKPAATDHPEADLGSLISKSENLQEDRETDFKVVSDKSVGATLEGVDKSDPGAHQSEDNCETFEIITPHSSEVMVKSTDDSATKQEVSTPIVKQDTQPTKEDNLEALDQISEDNPSYDTKTPQISDIERIDTPLVQVSEAQSGVEDDVKPNPEQMLHHEMEQLLSKVEDSKSSQSFQSEINVVSDSQPHDSSAGIDEKTSTGFQQSDIRRKLGSRRRNKGKQQIKDNEPTEDADGNTKGHESSETTEIPLTSETADQEKSTETMLEGMNRFDTHPIEEENTQTDTHVCTSELTTTGKHSSPTADKQVIDLSHCTQMPDEDLLGVHSVTDTENKERDECTDLLRLDENLPEDPLVSNTQVSPFTLEISIEEIRPGEHTEVEFGAEKATDSSQKDKLSMKEEQLSNSSGTQHSEDAVKKVDDEQDIQPTQIQDEQQNYYSPESLILLDATEKVDTSFGNLKDQTDMRDTNQSELSVKITDDSAPQEEVPNPDDKQDERPTQEKHLEASDQRNEDSNVYDSKQPLINNTEREDTAVGQVNEGEGQVDDVVKHKDEQAVQQDNEGVISDVEKSTFSPQTLLSEIDAPFDSNRQDTSVSVDEQTNTGFDLGGNRRKLGSSRKKKERKQGKESKEEVLENTTSDEALEITKMAFATETRIQEDFSQEAKRDVAPSVLHDSSMILVSTPGYSEVQKPVASDHPEADLGSFITKNENLQEDQEDRQTGFKEMTDKSVGATLEKVDTSDIVAHQSEVNIKKMQEEEGKTTEILQIDNISANAADDATDNSKIVEIIATLPPAVMVTSIDDSATKQEEVSNPDDKKDAQPTKGENLGASDQISEDNPSYDSKTPQISDIERVDTPLVQVSESDTVTHQSDVNVKKTQEEEGKTTEMQQIDNISASVTDDATDNSKIDEIIAILPSEVMVKSTDDSATKEEGSNPDDKKDAQPTKEDILNVSDQISEDNPSYDTKTPQTSDIERVDTPLVQGSESEGTVEDDVKPNPEQTFHQEDANIFSELEDIKYPLESSESETNVASDPQAHDSSVGIDEETNTGNTQTTERKNASPDLTPTNRRRKMGSTRRNLGSRKKEDLDNDATQAEIIVGNVTTESVPGNKEKELQLHTEHEGDEALEITKMPLATETRLPEDLNQGIKHDVAPSVLNDSSMILVSTPGYSEVQKPAATDHPEADLGSFIPKNENLQEDQEDRPTDFKEMPDKLGRATVEEADTSDTVAHQSEVNVKKTQEEEGNTTEMQQIDNISASVTDDATDNSKIVEIIATLPSEVMVKSTDDSATKQEVSTPIVKQDTQPTKEDNLDFLDQTSEDNPSYDTKTPEISDIERVDTPLVQVSESDTVTHQSEVNVKKTQEEEGKTTEILQIDNFSTSAIGDATDNSKIVEIITILPPAVMVESTEDSATKQEEVSNPDDKKDAQPTKEENLGASDQISEDNPSYDSKTPKTSDIDRVDTPLVQVSESEGTVEDDVKPNPGQTVHQEAANIFSELEDIKFPLQSSESETNVASDPQPHDSSVGIDEETNTGNTQTTEMKNTSPNLTPTNRRRKMGSTRRNLGSRKKEHLDNDATQAEIIVGNVTTESVPGNKEKELQLHTEHEGDEALEIAKMLLATETRLQEDFSQGAKCDVAPSVLHDSSMILVSTPGYSDVQKPAATDHPEADLGSFIPKNENLQEDQEDSQTDFKEMTDKSVGATLENVDTSDIVAHQSEVNVKKTQEEEGNTTDMQQIDNISASVTDDATDNSKIVEIIATLPSEVMVKSMDDLATKQEVSNPDDKKDAQPTKEDNLDVLDQISEDNPSNDTKTPHTINIERVDTPLVQVSKAQSGVEDYVKPNPGQTVHQEAANIFSELEDIKFPLQSSESETNVASDPQAHDSSVGIDEETNTGNTQTTEMKNTSPNLTPTNRRRKMGSTRRNLGSRKKGEDLDNDATEAEIIVGDVLTESVPGNKEKELQLHTEHEGDEALEITKMPLATETKIQEDFSQEAKHDVAPSVLHDSSMILVSTPGYSEVQKPAATDHPEADLGSFIPKNENLQEDQEDRQTDFKEMTDKSVGATLEKVDTSDTVGHQSEVNVKKMQEEEGKTTEMQQTDNISANAADDATDNSKIIEIIATLPPTVMVTSIDDSATKQEEVSNPDDKKDAQPTKGENLGASDQISEDNPSYDSTTPQASDIERVDTPLVQVSEGTVEDDVKPNPEQTFHQEAANVFSELEDIKFPLESSESETNVASDPQPHDSSAGIDEETNTGFKQRDIRRKLGSSRRNKGKRQFKEADENKIEHEHSETTETPLTTETANQEKSAETMLEGMNKFDTHQTEEDIRQLPDESLLDFDSVTDLEKGRDGAQHLEDAEKKVHDHDIKPIQMQEMPQTDNTSVSVIDGATNIPEIFIDLTDIRDIHLSKLAVKSTDYDTKEINFESSDQGKEADRVFDTKKPQLSDTERTDTALGDYVSESQVKDDIKSSAGKTGRQEAGLISEMGDSDSSLQSLQHELHAALDSKPQQNNTSFNSGGNTRKLGSSQEKSMETMLEGKDKSDSAQIKDTIHVKQNEYFGPLDGISEFSSSAAVDRQQGESNSSEMPDEELPITSYVTENKEKDENTELLRQDGRSRGSDLFSESHVESESKESPTTMEITTEKSSSREHTKVESSVEQSSESAPKKELALSGEQNECFNPFEVTGAEQSEDVVNKVHEELINPIHGQELLQIETGPKICLQALPSEINIPLDSQQDEPQSIKDESPTGPNPARSRRKLGSSRRNKGKQHAKEDAPENTRDDEASTTPNISLVTETARQEELTDIESPEKIRKISSNVNEDENTEKLPDKDSTFSKDSSTVVTADNDFLKSNKDVDDKDKKLVKEPENLSHLIGYDKNKIEACVQPPQASVWKDDSHMQNISYHDDTVDILAQEEASQPQNTEDLLRQDIDVQQTNDVTENVRHVMMESSVDKQGEVGQNFEDSTNKIEAAQEINTSNILISTAQERVEDVESGISTAMAASNSQEDNPSDHKKTLQVKPNQKRRKMGSTRRNQLNRKQEGETDDKDETTESEVNAEADVRNLDEMQDVKEPVLSAEVSQNENATTLLGAVYKEQQEGNEISSAHDEGHQLESSTSNLQSSESNVTPGRDDLMALLPEPSASHTEEAVDPDRKDGGRNVVVGVEPLQPEEFTSSETQITPVIAERNRRSLDQLLPLNTDTTANTGITGGSPVLSETTRNDDERAESATEIQDKVSTQQKPNIAIEEAQVKIPETKSASPNLTPTNRRRKMGSTRRNLGTRNKGEDLDNEAREAEIIVGDVKTESVPGIKEKELQLHTEHSEGDPEQERLLETVENSQAGEYQSTLPTQQIVEKNPVSQGELLDTEQQISNYLPSTSTKNDTKSVSASGGKRRKMGSHRKSRGHQGYGEQTEEQEGILDEQNETNVRSIPEEGVIKPSEEHKEEPLGLQNLSEGDDRDKKPSSNIIISKPGEHSGSVSEKTPFQPSRAENRLGQEQFSLAGDPRGLRSESYHVVMIGDSCVGKTSFMKRAQTGKFSLDIPSSIGLDSCMWTVVVDGKPVVLELWDTAGQERFRSITRHIFHRAQAFLLMYDITCTESFSAVSYWANCIQESAVDDVIVLLLGNKSDCAKRQVKSEQGEILAKEYNFEFMECSAATGENVVQCLETVARMLNQKIGTREEATVVQQEAGQKKRSTCC